MGATSYAQIKRAPLSDPKNMEVIWTSPDMGMMRAYAVGDNKILMGIAMPSQAGTLLYTYIMNTDGFDAIRLDPMCGLEYKGIMRPAICNGRVYYPTQDGSGTITCTIRSCALDGSDDRVICSHTLDSAKDLNIWVMGESDGLLCYSIDVPMDAGTTSHNAYTVPVDAANATPTQVVAGSEADVDLAIDRFVTVDGSSLVSYSVVDGSRSQIASFDRQPQSTLDCLCASPSYYFLVERGGSSVTVWRFDVKAGTVVNIGSYFAADSTYSIVGDDVYVSCIGVLTKYDLSLREASAP